MDAPEVPAIPVIGRFAPSPTGRMHAGNIFAALVAWLVARSQGGQMVLRVEDLDRERSKPAFIDDVQRDFERLGLFWDRGPYFQHDRDEAYQLCSHLVLMKEGRVLAKGKTRELFQNPGTWEAARLCRRRAKRPYFHFQGTR